MAEPEKLYKQSTFAQCFYASFSYKRKKEAKWKAFVRRHGTKFIPQQYSVQCSTHIADSAHTVKAISASTVSYRKVSLSLRRLKTGSQNRILQVRLAYQHKKFVESQPRQVNILAYYESTYLENSLKCRSRKIPRNKKTVICPDTVPKIGLIENMSSPGLFTILTRRILINCT